MRIFHLFPEGFPEIYVMTEPRAASPPPADSAVDEKAGSTFLRDG